MRRISMFFMGGFVVNTVKCFGFCVGITGVIVAENL